MNFPPDFNLSAVNDIHDFIEQFSFGILVCNALEATHLPFILDRNCGELGTLRGHFAKSNPHWQDLDGKQALVIFSGPHVYISPTWYSQHPAVPTWNYSTVHAHGLVSLLDEEATLRVLRQSVEAYEPELLQQTDILTPAHVERLANHVVGFEILLTSVKGKHKLGQKRSAKDQASVFNALANSDNPANRDFARYLTSLTVGD